MCDINPIIASVGYWLWKARVNCCVEGAIVNIKHVRPKKKKNDSITLYLEYD